MAKATVLISSVFYVASSQDVHLHPATNACIMMLFLLSYSSLCPHAQRQNVMFFCSTPVMASAEGLLRVAIAEALKVVVFSSGFYFRHHAPASIHRTPEEGHFKSPTFFL